MADLKNLARLNEIKQEVEESKEANRQLNNFGKVIFYDSDGRQVIEFLSGTLVGENLNRTIKNYLASRIAKLENEAKEL